MHLVLSPALFHEPLKYKDWGSLQRLGLVPGMKGNLDPMTPNCISITVSQKCS